MHDSFAAPTPLTGPHRLSRRRAVLHWFGHGRERARVFVLPDGACRVVRRGERLGLRAALAGGYRGLYYVDEDGHTVDLVCELPSRENGLQFDARVRLLWWVHDVEQVVQSRVGDVRQSLQPFLEAYLGRMTREHAVADIGAAEERVRRELTGDMPLEIGLTIRPLTVRLRLDEVVAPAHVDEMADVQREILLEQARGKLAAIRAQNEVAAWQVRLAFYRGVVEAGLPSLLALKLMTDPSSATEVAGFALQAGEGLGTSWPAWPSPDAVEAGQGEPVDDDHTPLGRAAGAGHTGIDPRPIESIAEQLKEQLQGPLPPLVYVPEEPASSD